MKLCKCGCGNSVTKESNIYINGHCRRGIKSSNITKIKISKSKKGCIPWNKGLKDYLNDESLQKMKDYASSRLKDKNPAWKGGCIEYKHHEAWKLFGKEHCEHCDISLIDYKNKYNRRFDMHCNSLPKDYSIMEQSNWMCLCVDCHRAEELNKE